MKLKDRTAIITGAASGIGAAIAEKIAEHGAGVALWDINEKGLNEMKEKLSKYDVRVETYVTNVTDYDNVQIIGKNTILDFGHIDILVNCAGGGKDLSLGFLELDEDSWGKQIDLNLNSVFYCCKSIIHHMVDRRYGKIINLGSVAGMRGGGLLGRGGYSSGKSGVIGFTKALAKEVGEYGIHVNTVAPALHVTPLITNSMSEERIEEIKQSFPLKTAGDPEKLGELIAFLASDDAQFITGSLITVDGGYSMH